MSGEVAVKVTNEEKQSPGVLFNFRLGYISGSGDAITEKLCQLYVTLDHNISTNIPEIVDSLPPKEVPENGSLERVVSEAKDLHELALMEAWNEVESFAEEARETRQEFLDILFEHEIILNPGDEWFQIQNYVCMGNLEREVDLSTLSLGLGLNITEYEPEQFPGLVYRPEDHGCVMLIFSSGNVVITGTKGIEAAESAFSGLIDQLNNFV